MNEPSGAKYEYNPLPTASKDQAVTAVQENISALRQEYAGMDYPRNTHEYLGVVEDLEQMLAVLQTKHDQLKEQHREATYILEYHKSCALPPDSTFLIYSFGLQARFKEEGTEHRSNTFIGWKIDYKPEYPEENAICAAAKKGVTGGL
jgi:hypothetical protein